MLHGPPEARSESGVTAAISGRPTSGGTVPTLTTGLGADRSICARLKSGASWR
jgi:hypothetical protein